ncbi:MAG: hypothetical protein RR185_05545, partial [Angelakisella sp.]
MLDKDYLTGLGLEEAAANAVLEQLECERQQAEELRQQAEEQKQQPRLLSVTPGGGRGQPSTQEFAKLGYGERVRLKHQNPELY